ncbi:hypothetical protein [Streptomyces zinciresistens]|uniref:hypothetical protein n=1 Tax=Streptomyces zinciresistens TaxID=1073330 RepID=UPI0002E9812C|nr:hypothetical protein [Streptomyces zinciresistens]
MTDDGTAPALRSHATPPWHPPADATGPRYRLASDGVLTAPDGATYTQGPPTGHGNGFFGALSAALRDAAARPGLAAAEATRLRRRADMTPAQLMRLNGLPGAPADRNALFTPPPPTRGPGGLPPSRIALEDQLRRYLTRAPWGAGADRAVAEWASSATGTTVTLIEENGTAHTYRGPSGDTGPQLRLRRRGGDFVPLAERTPAPPTDPASVPLPPSPLATTSTAPELPGEEEAFDLSTLSGARPTTAPATGTDSRPDTGTGSRMDLDSDEESERDAVRTSPEGEFATEFADLLDEPELRLDALLDVVRRRNERLGGLPDVAFDSAFTEATGIGLPEALDQVEQAGRLASEEYERLRDALGLGTGGPFTRTTPTGSSARDRDVTLRMLDRVARLVKEVLRKPNRQDDAQVTPHIAVGMLPDGSLGIAGNTGTKALTQDEAAQVEDELRWFVTGQEPAGTPRQRELEQRARDEETHRQTAARLDQAERALADRTSEQEAMRARLEQQYASSVWDDALQSQWETLLADEAGAQQERQTLTAERRQWRRDERWLARRRPGIARELRDTKLRALATGWYRLYHPESPELDLVKRALARPRILNVAGRDATPDVGAHGSEHGELTLLGQWVAHWESHPGEPANPQTLNLGGFKMACASCDLAYQAVNQHVGGPLGHRVQASGTHGMFFPGWRMPDWMRARPALEQHIRDNAETIGAYLDQGGVLQGERTDTTDRQYPADSSSEYESGDGSYAGSVEGGMDVDSPLGSPAPEAAPRLPRTTATPLDANTATPPAPRGRRDNRPRFVVRSGFDARRFSFAGEPVTDLTVRVAFRGPREGVAQVRSRLAAGVETLLNAPAHRLPNGDRLHVTVEYVEPGGDPHLTVDLVGRDRAMDQTTWWADAEQAELVHELTHQLGMRDEYRDAGSPQRPHIPGSLLGDLNQPPEDPSLAPAGLRGRHLALMSTLIGELPAGTAQNARTWDSVRTAVEPVLRRAVWVDPVSLPGSAGTATEGDVAARMQQEATLTPFRSGNYEFTNLKHTDERYRDKAVRIIDLLRRDDTIREYIGGRPCRITLHVRTTETPADVTDRGEAGVDINLASYYFEKYDMGYIMGMLAHEIGLHPLAARDTNIPDEEEMFADVPLAVPGLSELKTPRTMSTRGAGQADHIMAAFPSSTRHGIYRDMVVRMAGVLAGDARRGEEGARPKDVTDLIDTYLMDLATIAVTNDRRKSAAWEPGYTARAYNAYKEMLVARLPQDSPVLGLLPADKSWYNVTGNFLGLGGSFAFNNRGDSIQTAADATEAVPRLPRPPAAPQTVSGTGVTPEPTDADPAPLPAGRPVPTGAGPAPLPAGRSAPRRGRDNRPRYVVRSGFDARRFSYGGEPVTDLTVRVALRGTDADTAQVYDRLTQGVHEFLNDPGHRLPNGDRLHVTVELVRPADSPHLTVDLVGRDRAMDQRTWWADAEPVQLVHELTHQLGMRDEYRDAGSPQRPHIPGSLLGDLNEPPEDPSLAPGGLRGRHLALLSALIGNVTAQPQPEGRTWEAARTSTTPAPRQSVWVDPVSLPGSTGTATDGDVAARMQQEATLTPFKSGRFEFTNLKHTDPRYREKAVRIIELLGDHPTIRDYIGDRPCRITLHLRTTETPADVRDLGDEGVQINLASYYFEKYDIGYIMGMLSHEIGLHPLASRNSDIPDEEAMFRGIPLPVPGLTDLRTPRTMNTDTAGQADHIMAAFPSSTRHGIYRDIVLTTADMLALAARAGVEGAKAKDVTDLIDCYLMDLASIAITSDYRMNAAKEPGNTAKVYNAYKALLAQHMAEDSPARPLLPADKGLFGVVRDFTQLAASLATNNRGDSIQRPVVTDEAPPRLPQPQARPAPADATAPPRPRGARDNRPRFVVRSGFDTRRFSFGGEPVTDLTVRLALRGPEADRDEVRRRLDAGVAELLNDPAYRLPNGDRLHVTVEHVEASGDPHVTVDLVGRDRAMDQTAWWTDAETADLVHELTHQLGLRDEYRDAASPQRPHIPGSLLGDLRTPPEDPSLTPAGLRGRHLALLATLIGYVPPAPQTASPGPGPGAGRTWDTARAGAAPVPHRAVWVDPVSLPGSTGTPTEGDVPARAPQGPAPTPFTVGNFSFTNLNQTDERYLAKAARIADLLLRHDTIRDYVGGRPCRITLRVRTTETPADVTDRGEDGVDINLASYYFENYGMGHIMGMLSHEIGLHPLAARDTGIRDEEEMFAGFPLAVPGLSGLRNPRTMNTEGSGQADHIMAAYPSSSRHAVYRDIVVGMAAVLAEDAQLGRSGATPRDVTDLIDCYLMDLASIAVTNDHRANAALEPGYTARVYNAYKAALLAGLPADSPLRALLPADKGMLGVMNDFRVLASAVAIGIRGDSIERTGAA